MSWEVRQPAELGRSVNVSWEVRQPAELGRSENVSWEVRQPAELGESVNEMFVALYSSVHKEVPLRHIDEHIRTDSPLF